MPRGSWLGFVASIVLAAPVAGQELGTLPAFPALSPPAPGAGVPPHGGGAGHGESPLKDLTPPGFADLIPPPDPHHAHGEVPGHLAPLAPGHAGFYTSAEYLLLRPRSGSFDYALLNATAGSLGTIGPIESLRYSRGNGLRVEGGYRFKAGWDVGVAYTYLNAIGSDFVNAGPGQIIFPTTTRPGLTDTATSASAKASTNYNLYDLVVGKRWVVDDHFAVRAFAGFRFADFGQRFDVLYDGADARRAAVNMRSGFDGFGPLIGGEAVLGGWHGWHGYARANGGLLSGRSTNSLLETNNAGGTTYVDTQYDVRQVVPVAGIAIGGGWQYRSFSVRAGYEVTHWFGLTQPVRFVDDVGQGKLVTRPSNYSLEGFFFQLGFAF